jgi:hypothetical protein
MALALAATVAPLFAGCGSGSLANRSYLVPKGDRHVLADTYDRMLAALEQSHGDDPADVLNGATTGQRMLYVMFFVDDEIANGGLYQVYWNLQGGFIQEAVRDADAIGAHHWASLVRKAGRSLFPNGIPDDIEAQRRELGCPDYCDNGSLDSLTNQWRDGELRRPLLRYVEAHPAEFYSSS